MKKDTQCVHGKSRDSFNDATGAISTPIYMSATFKHPEFSKSTGFDYSRLANPTRSELESHLATLENGVDCVAFSSGMSAVDALMCMFSAGDHILATDDLYGGSIRLFTLSNKRLGINFDYIDTSNLSNLKDKIKPNTKAIFIETPTNPMMDITDIQAVSDYAKKINPQILIVVDNTLLTPYFQKPLELGADIVIHSGTKYIAGHNDVLCGLLIVNSANLSEQIRFITKTTGACLSPFDSWLVLRGVKTLALRMQRHEKNAKQLFKFLQTCKKINKIFFAGDESHKNYNIMSKQTTGCGGMISFEVDSDKTAKDILKNVKLIAFAESLGGVESLITYPYYQTHADVPDNERLARGINDKLLRISVGIEDINDIIADLTQALK